MALRVCSTPSCPTLVDAGTRGGRCTPCQRTADLARGTRQQRGYDATYDAEHRRWQQRIDSGEVVLCARCHEPIGDEPWDLGHDDQDRTKIHGPEHRARCNRAAAGRTSHPT